MKVIKVLQVFLLYNLPSKAEVTKHCYINHFRIIQMCQAKAAANSTVQ